MIDRETAQLGDFTISRESAGHIVVKHEGHEIHILNWGKSYNVEIYSPRNDGDLSDAKFEYRKESADVS